MLGHANARNRVIGAVVDIAVVLDSDLHTVSDALLDGPAAGIVGLFTGKSNADDLHAELASSLADKGPPAATNVENAHARLESELARDKVTLSQLGLIEAERRSRLLVVVGTGVCHGLSEHQLVERVARLEEGRVWR